MEEENTQVNESKSGVQMPPSRGVPSKSSIQFEYDKLPLPVTARWDYEDVLKIIFPPKFQNAQYDLAKKVILLVKEKGAIDGDALGDWATKNNIPNSTLRNLVIPKLIRVGMLTRERQNPSGQTNQDKKHRMILKISTKFGEAFQHIGREWNGIVESWKLKK
ncbi:Uncharacterised protein [uncultured archaeon]|nr:Uncharacterised protein [uncultured archaeon]